MTSGLSTFAARLREFIATAVPLEVTRSVGGTSPELGTRRAELQKEPPQVGCYEEDFSTLALELFALQFAHNAVYRKFCEARRVSPLTLTNWLQIPAVPTTAFKELDLTCLAPAERTHVFYSSGTTEHRPSRHFHNAESLAVYEAALWGWFARHVVPDFRFQISDFRLAALTPPPALSPNSSLAYMFECVRQKLGADHSSFCGLVTDGAWGLDLKQTIARLQFVQTSGGPTLLLGTAFSFVHLLDELATRDLRFQLPPGSRVLETGGYKGRSRELPKAELHEMITERLGISPSQIVCEYGMSELSSQAYDAGLDATRNTQHEPCSFHFPPWARAQVISPETGREITDGETGLLRVFDLANVFSVMAIQTEDLAARRGAGFELLGRAALAEPRGCSLMAV